MHRVVTSLLVFGADLRSCLALQLKTEATGSEAPQVLSETVALVREKLLPTMRRLRVSDRVQPAGR
jgi:DNA-directed RNA polymerase specialized sigma54-like protein